MKPLLDPCSSDRPEQAAGGTVADARLREAFDGAVAAVAVVRGTDRTLEYANPAFVAICPAAGAGRSAVAELGMPGLAAAVEEVLDHGLGVRAEEQRTPRVEEQLATLTVSPVPGPAGVDALVVGLDVTGQAQDRRDMQRRVDETRWVDEATEALLQDETDPVTELTALTHALVPAFADACSAILLDAPAVLGVDTGGAPLRGRRVAFAAADESVALPSRTAGLTWGSDIRVLHDAVRLGRPVAHVFGEDGTPWDDVGGSREWMRTAGVTSVAAVPIRVGDRIVGILVFAGATRSPFSRADLAVMDRLATRAGTALGQGMRFARQREASLTLQRSMLTQAPTVPGLEVVSRYRPSVADDEVGGDWYDAFALPGGDLMVAIGDVAGHDLDAAATMGQLRSMLRALAVDRDDASPDELLTRLDTVATNLDVTDFTSLVLGRLHRDTEVGTLTLRWSCAGHPAPLLLPWNAAPQLLERGTGMVLGVRPRAPRATASIELEPGSTVLLYTDGLVERRGRNPDANVVTLVGQAARSARRAVGASRVPLDRLCDELVTRAPVDDDVAVLAVRALPGNPADEGR